MAKVAVVQSVQSASDEPIAFGHITHDKKRRFLIAFAETGSAKEAASLVPCARSSAYLWRKDDAEFATAFRDAEQMSADLLESIAYERATRKDFPSDTLCIFLLKGLRPERYRENSRIELTGANGGPVQLQAGRLSDEELLLAEKLARKMRAEQQPQIEAPPAIDTTSEVVAETPTEAPTSSEES